MAQLSSPSHQGDLSKVSAGQLGSETCGAGTAFHLYNVPQDSTIALSPLCIPKEVTATLFCCSACMQIPLPWLSCEDLHKPHHYKNLTRTCCLEDIALWIQGLRRKSISTPFSKPFWGTYSECGAHSSPTHSPAGCSLGREGQGKQHEDEQMKEMAGRGFASRDVAEKPNGTCHGTCPAEPAWDIAGAAPNMPLPAGAKAVAPRHLVETQSRSTARVWISAGFPSPCLHTAKD